jgi:hypothetical protein
MTDPRPAVLTGGYRHCWPAKLWICPTSGGFS